MKGLVVPAHLFLKVGYGSEVAWAYNIISGLARKFNVEIDVICGEGTFNESNVRLFETGFGKGNLYSRAFFTYRYYNLAKRLLDKADIVHHMFPFGFGCGFNPLATFGCLRKKPFVIGPIQYPQEYSDVTDFTWARGKGGMWTGLLYYTETAIVSLALKTLEKLHKTTLEEAEALVFDSERALELYKRKYADLLRGKISKVIPPGVEEEFFVESAWVKKDEFEILTVGYILRRKGIQHLIRAMSTILEEFGNVKLKVVGSGPYKQNLMTLTKELSLSKYVEFSDYVPRNELPKVYANCDLYVQPSLSETFPATIREAMAAGRPVVSTDVGIIAEYVKDGHNGCLVQPESSEALARRIVDLLKDEDRRAKMGEEARKYAEENFNWDRLAKAWYEIYNCVM